MDNGSILASLEAPSKRPKVFDTQLIVKVPKAVKQQLIDIAKDQKTDLSVITRDAVREYLERRGIK